MYFYDRILDLVGAKHHTYFTFDKLRSLWEDLYIPMDYFFLKGLKLEDCFTLFGWLLCDVICFEIHVHDSSRNKQINHETQLKHQTPKAKTRKVRPTKHPKKRNFLEHH